MPAAAASGLPVWWSRCWTTGSFRPTTRRCCSDYRRSRARPSPATGAASRSPTAPICWRAPATCSASTRRCASCSRTTATSRTAGYRPRTGDSGRSPLDVMKRHGYEGILAVRRYLDFERGRVGVRAPGPPGRGLPRRPGAQHQGHPRLAGSVRRSGAATRRTARSRSPPRAPPACRAPRRSSRAPSTTARSSPIPSCRRTGTPRATRTAWATASGTARSSSRPRCARRCTTGIAS